LRVPFQRPLLPPLAEIERYFAASRSQRRYSNSGPCHDLLAVRASALLDDRAVVPVSSAGIGLIVALRALVAVRPGAARQIVVPSFTFAATAAAIVWSGFEPVFCDIEAEGWHLCPDRLNELLADGEDRIAGILACSAFGTPPPAATSTAWVSAAERSGIPLIVDSAAGIGAGGDRIQADAEVFSMHATKPLAVGEGGLVALADEDDAATVRTLINHGVGPDHSVVAVGLNGKLDEWSCATALAALDHLDAGLNARRKAAAAMRRAIDSADVSFQARAADSPSQFVPVLMSSEEHRDEVLRLAGERGIELRTYYTPLHMTPAYGHCPRGGMLEVTESVSRRMLSLPMAVDLSGAELADVATCFAI
jgi:dTDP-4-amino-4,6-dideoxygalactose transaminase